ncbi:hypothetical protein LXL04_007795 [Taraxacum kok-saghyz]
MQLFFGAFFCKFFLTKLFKYVFERFCNKNLKYAYMQRNRTGNIHIGVPARCAGDSFIRRIVSFRKTERPVIFFEEMVSRVILFICLVIRIMSHEPHSFDEWFVFRKHDKKEPALTVGVPARCAGDSFIRRMVSFRETERPAIFFRKDEIERQIESAPDKRKHTSNFLAFEASLMSIRDNKVLEVEFKFDSICCSLSITTASSNPSAVVPKLPLFYTPSKPFIPAAKTQDPINSGEKLEQHKSKDNNVKGNPNNKDENDYLYSYEERLEQHIK